MTESNAVAFPCNLASLRRRSQYCIRTIAPLVTGSYRRDGENYSRLDMSRVYVVHRGSLIIIAVRHEETHIRCIYDERDNRDIFARDSFNYQSIRSIIEREQNVKSCGS